MHFLSLIITLLSFSTLAEDCKLIEPRYQISGHFLETHFHQGGVEMPFDESLPIPVIGETLYIVSLKTENHKSNVIQEIKTDENGYFEVKVPAGWYGFSQKPKRLGPGQHLPENWTEGDEFESRSESWSISTNGPVEVVDKNVSGITITRHKSSICMMCP